MKYVIAGNFAEFRNWRMENCNVRHAVYVSSPERLRGIHVPKEDIVWYGTYYERKDIGDFRIAVKLAETRQE